MFINPFYNMRNIFLLILLFSYQLVFSQVKIHAHNDYEKPYPLFTALKNKVFSVEADVFLKGDKLVVAHTKQQIDETKTLNSLYLKPILHQFRQYNGFITADTAYQLALVIDIKEKGEDVLKQLIKMLELNRKYFDRSLNRHAVQIIISGDRGAIGDWGNYPDYIFFDGRPYEKYDTLTWERVAIISDTYRNYVDTGNKMVKLTSVIKGVHQHGKMLRLWATPDTEEAWLFLHNTGVDIINTDKVEACRKFFDRKR